MVMFNYIIVILLLILSGLFSGLTLGLLGLNVFDIKRKARAGNKFARKIYPLRKQGNLLLVTLLLGNVAVNSTLAVFLGTITAGVIAGVVATSLIVLFGEIIPQAVFSRYALTFGSKLTWLVYVFLFLFYPVAKPIAMGLDYFLSDELPTIFSRREFRYLIQEHKRHKKTDLEKHDFEILEGGLKYSEKEVRDVMTPRKHTFFLYSTDKLGKTNLRNIQKKGHSRIPVYSQKSKKMVGILYMKDVVAVSPADRVVVKKVMRRDVHRIKETSKLNRVLHLFKEKRVHLFIVNNDAGRFTGIITLEDVLEEIVGEIVDEHDLREDMREGK